MHDDEDDSDSSDDESYHDEGESSEEEADKGKTRTDLEWDDTNFWAIFHSLTHSLFRFHSFLFCFIFVLFYSAFIIFSIFIFVNNIWPIFELYFYTYIFQFSFSSDIHSHTDM